MLLCAFSLRPRVVSVVNSVSAVELSAPAAEALAPSSLGGGGEADVVGGLDDDELPVGRTGTPPVVLPVPLPCVGLGVRVGVGTGARMASGVDVAIGVIDKVGTVVALGVGRGVPGVGVGAGGRCGSG